MKKNINLIFDFDGTLVDSFAIAIEKFNLLAKEFNFCQVNPNEISELKNLTSKELIKYLKIPILQIPKFLIKARALLRNEIAALPTFANLPEVIMQLHEMGFKLGILTSNSGENVRAWLVSNKMQHFFHFTHAESSFFGKKHLLKKIIKNYQMDKSLTFYIGDETRDIEAAKACSINAIAVTWGFNSEKILARYQPHFMARKSADILNILETFI